MNARLPHPFAAIVGRLLRPPPRPAAVSRSRRLAPLERLAGEFRDVLCFPEDAEALILGLRRGTPIVLRTGESAPVAAFSSPTGPLNYANVRIVLALARAELAARGIATANAEQLRSVVLGDAENEGILSRRAAGFGWGRIAHGMGLKLGAVVKGRDDPQG